MQLSQHKTIRSDIDEFGAIKSDGDELFRLLSYEWWSENHSRDIEDFKMPAGSQFIGGNDPDNPLTTWLDTPKRKDGIKLARKKIS